MLSVTMDSVLCRAAAECTVPYMIFLLAPFSAHGVGLNQTTRSTMTVGAPWSVVRHGFSGSLSAVCMSCIGLRDVCPRFATPTGLVCLAVAAR
jgi:hypothetical protein